MVDMRQSEADFSGCGCVFQLMGLIAIVVFTIKGTIEIFEWIFG